LGHRNRNDTRGWIAARPVIGPALTGLFEENPSIVRMPIVSDLLRAELDAAINAPGGPDDSEFQVIISDGDIGSEDPVGDLQEVLASQGITPDPGAFRYLMVLDRVDQLIKPGEYTMRQTMTPAQIVSKLQDPDPPTPVVTLALRPGLRIEQIVAYLERQTEETDLELDPKEFLALATDPRPEVFDEYHFLRQIPKGNGLEGYLAGGTYPVPIDINADEFLHLLLQQWEENSGDLVVQAKKQGLDFYDALTIASLVEREAKVDADRARIAGVYWNRLDPKLNGQTGGLMQADPSVVYATDSTALDDLAVNKWPGYLFWDTLGVADLATVNVNGDLQSHQTYQNPGLPQWPIATPTRTSLEAALEPDTSKDLLFFYACPGSDTHTFARTAAQHSRNIAKCQ